MIISSIRLSFVGAQVDCRTKTSWPRTFSWISTITSPSEKRPTTQRPEADVEMAADGLCERGFALPVKTIRPSRPSGTGQHPGGRAACSGTAHREMAGEEGFEPSNAGIKIRCLNQLGDSPAEKPARSIGGATTRAGTRSAHSRERRERMARERAGDEALRCPCGRAGDRRARLLLPMQTLRTRSCPIPSSARRANARAQCVRAPRRRRESARIAAACRSLRP